jgi:hypothetical protein
LEWLFHNGISDAELTSSHDKASYPAATLQRSLRTCADRLFHTPAGIAWGFDEEAYSPNTDALPE